LLKKIFSTLYVNQAVVDDIQQHIASLKSVSKKGYEVLFKNQNKYFRDSVTPDKVKKRLELLENIKEFIKKECKIVGLDEELSEADKKLAEVLTPAALFSIVVAKQKNTILLSDDLFFLQLSESHSGVQGVSVQMLLRYLRIKGLIVEKEFFEAILYLIKLNYSYILIDEELVTYLFSKNFYKITPDLRLVLEKLGDIRTSDASLVSVTCKFIKSTWLTSIIHTEKTLLIDLILVSITKYHSPEIIIPAVLKGLSISMRFVPQYFDAIKTQILSWAKFNFPKLF